MIYDWIKNKVPRCAYVKKRVNDDMLIVCGSDLSLYYLNRTAGFFLDCVDGISTIDTIKSRFMEKFDVAQEELEDDLIDMIRDMQWKKLITLED